MSKMHAAAGAPADPCGLEWNHGERDRLQGSRVACKPWLEAELYLVRPEVLVPLGATAAQALLGRGFRVSRQRGQLVHSPLAPAVIATVHPSSILRAPDDETRRAERLRFVDDLKRVAQVLARAPASVSGV